MSKSIRAQCGVLPIIRHEGALRVLLITSRETRRWVIPKGWPAKNRAPHEQAAREAFEEAGLIGQASSAVFGVYHYVKRLSHRRSVTCEVRVHLMEVDHELDQWPEQEQRQRQWIDPAEAARLVDEPELGAMLRRLAEQPA